MSDQISFIAALAGQNTAAKWLGVDSEGSSKVVLEVPSTELANVMRLAALAKRSFRVTVEAD